MMRIKTLFLPLLLLSLLLALAANASNDVGVQESVEIQEEIKKDIKAGARSSTSMSKGETMMYALGTAVTIPLGYASLKMPTPAAKQAFHLVFGIMISYAIAGNNILHQIVESTVVLVIIKVVPRSMFPHGLAFGWCMLYLLFFRLCHLFFPEWPDKLGPNGAMMMITTYRLVSVAFDVRAQPLTKVTQDGKKVLEDRVESPSLLLYYSYVFSFAGLVVGPVITFRDFAGYLQQNFVQLPETTMTAMWKRLKRGALWTGLWLVMVLTFPKAPLSDLLNGWQGLPFALHLIFTLALSCYTIRFQYYVVWSIAEQGCMWAGIGGTPTGYEEDQISCVEPDEVEVYSWLKDSEKRHTIGHIVKFWNMSIQRWLVRYVYRQFPMRSIRTLVVFLVSAYMHGVSAGFFAFFVQLAIFDVIQKKWQNIAWTPPFKNVAPIRWFYIFVYYNFIFRHFEYIICTFHMPSASTQNLYTIFECLGFYGHISGVIFVAIILLAPQQERPLARVYSNVNIPEDKQGESRKSK